MNEIKMPDLPLTIFVICGILVAGFFIAYINKSDNIDTNASETTASNSIQATVVKVPIEWVNIPAVQILPHLLIRGII